MESENLSTKIHTGSMSGTSGITQIEKVWDCKPLFHEEWHSRSRQRLLHHFGDRKITSWLSRHDEESLSKTVADDIVTYAPNPEMSYLENVYIHYILPRVEVKPEYADEIQVAWTEGVGHHFTQKARLIVDSHEFVMDPHVLDIHQDWFMKPGFSLAYREAIGDLPELTSWSGILPRYEGDVPQPWSFTQHQTEALPLFMLVGRKVLFRYSYAQPSTLLRMRVDRRLYDRVKTRIIKPVREYKKDAVVRATLETTGARQRFDAKDDDALSDTMSPLNRSKNGALVGKHDTSYGEEADWVVLKTEEVSDFMKYLVEPMTNWPTVPTMGASSTFNGTGPKSDDFDYYIKCKEGKRSYDFVEFLPFRSENPLGYGSSAIVDITTKLPVRAIYFFAVNATSAQTNQRSNYTTHVEHPADGRDPCINYSLTNGDIKEADKVPCSAKRFMSAWWHYPSMPREGMHSISFVAKHPSTHHDVSRTSSNGSFKLTVLLGSNNGMDDPNAKFTVHAYAHVVHKLDISCILGDDGKVKVQSVSLDKASGTTEKT